MQANALERFTKFLEKGPRLLDGGMGTLLLARRAAGESTLHSTTALLNLMSPESVVTAHRDFLIAGAELLVVNSFGASRPYLEPLAMENRLAYINSEAVRLARRAQSESGRTDGLIAGSIAPLPESVIGAKRQECFAEQARALIAAGVDLLLCETFVNPEQALAAVAGCKKVMTESKETVPLVLSMVPVEGSYDFAAWESLAELRRNKEIDLFGLNCGAGIGALAATLQRIDGLGMGPYWLKPSAGLPEMVGSRAVYPLGAQNFSSELSKILEKYSIAAVGGCCGVLPEHICRLGEQLEEHRSVVKLDG